MSQVLRHSALGCLLLSLGLVAVAKADGADVVVAKVGERTIPLSNLSRRLASLARFQRRALGKSAPAQGRQYLEQVMVPEVLLAGQVGALPGTTSARRRARENALLREVLVERLERQLRTESPVTDEETRRYYDGHPELFIQPERIRLQRLLVGTEAEARALLEKAKQLPTMDDWRNLVREKSLDKATSERGGELGFVAQDGTTEVSELVIDSALFAAAKTVKDGELVSEPVAEGKRFAVLWRRGSRPASSVDFAAEAPRIREYLAQLRTHEHLRSLSQKLRQSYLKDYRPGPVETAELSAAFERGFPTKPAAQ